MDGLQTELADGDNDDLYNGKEIVDAHGLDWYHYGMRYYDPILGRWMTTDPAGEYFSPYSYVGGDPINLVDPDGASSGPPCCDIGYGLNFTLSARSGGIGFRVSAAVGMRMRTPNVQVSQNLAVNLYNFGVGTREGTTGAREPQADLIYSVSATIGGGEQGRLPLHTHSGLTATGVSNDYAASVTHGQNFVLNSSGRNQRSGSHGIRLADMRLQTYNDVDVLLGDGDDRWWTGGGTLSALTSIGPATVGTEVYTGERMSASEYRLTYGPPSPDTPNASYDGIYIQWESEYTLNSGRSFVLTPASIWIDRGPKHSFSQIGIHNALGYPNFPFLE